MATKVTKNSPAKISWDRMRKQFTSYLLPFLMNTKYLAGDILFAWRGGGGGGGGGSLVVSGCTDA